MAFVSNEVLLSLKKEGSSETGMRCEDIMLSKTGHSQKDKDCVKEVYELSSQTPRKKYNGNFQELEEWGWRLLFKGT